MSSRQKSFFEQDHSKPHHRWQGSRATNDSLSKAGPPKSPAKASSQSRSKLQSFTFSAGGSSSQTLRSEKENRTNDALRKSQSPRKGDSEKTPTMSQSKMFPSTPAMRLPLADLVGNAEEALRRHDIPKEQSPEEQIGWIANSSHPDLTPGQKRRRAQSSSPISSSQERASDQLSSKEAWDLKNLQQNLKTPRTISDPTADLWSRYATGKAGDDPDARISSFAHLIEDSPPRSGPRTPGGSVGGLRRWASCGMDFPASKGKRRRTNGVFRDQESSEPGQKPLSRVGMLLEKVQASLAHPSHLRPDAPSSSSPLPDKGEFTNMASESPIRRQSRPASQGEKLSQRSTHSHRSREPDLSEFGDDDLDIDMEEAIQIPTVQPTSRPSNVQPHPVQTRPTGLRRQLSHPSAPFKPPQIQRRDQTQTSAPVVRQQSQQPMRPQQAAPVNNRQDLQHQPDPRMDTIEEDSDEFGDDDLDLALDDMDRAVPIFDSRSSSVNHSNTASAAPSRAASLNQNQQKPTHPPNQIQRPTAPPVPKQPPKAAPIQQPVEVDLTGFSDDDDDEDFGGLDLDDDAFEQVEFSATQAANQASMATSNSRNPSKSRAIQRYLVKQVLEGQFTNEKGRIAPEKVLYVEDETDKRAKAITLRQSWVDTHCTAGSYVHVVGGSFSSTGQITIDDTNHLLIVHPDHLISATVVADSFECIRRAVLQDRVKATSNTNESNVYGTILHEIFQEAMKANKWDPEWLNQLAETTLSKFLEKLFELGHEGTGKALEHLRSKMPELSSWATAFVKAKPGPDALAEDRNGKKVRLSITKLLDVEEHVWSPTYGLKGNIDATVQAVMQDEEGERALTVPFEVKTGRNTSSSSHRAQTALYTLLLSDRYDIDIIYGVLYYMETSAVSRIPAIRNELRHMIMQRNELASYVRERLQLPPMLQNPHKCNRCYAKTSCFLYHKLAEGGTTESAGVKEKFNELVGKLQPAHQDFFKKWDDLLTKEESEMMKFRRELWTMLSKEREKLGRCFSEVVIEPGSGRENEDMAKINRFSYTFLKKTAVPGFSFTESQITIGEPIVISSEQGHFALANGYVTKVSSRRISVAVDRRLHNSRTKLQGFNSQNNQAFVGIMDVEKQGPVLQDTGEIQVYRLDKDEFSNGMSTVRNNLLSIMDDSVYRSSDVRSLIVENRSPTFKAAPAKYSIPSGQMNPDQRAAIDKVMSAQDYALVLGMPGTGKTTTIAQIIRALVARGKSVLLTSYTHTAVDNILLKLRSHAGQKQEISILRLGTQSKVHPEVQEFATLAATPKHSLEEIQDAYMTPQVVATTCLGVSHFLFQKRVFDYCIVDEASQITLPVCIGPIRMARTFVLVGDHYQLPPLVQNKEAQEGGLDVSLFKLLSDSHPEAVVELGRQYRMCEEVMLLSNTLIYSGKLQCGTPAVAKRTLELPSFPRGLDRYHHCSNPTQHQQSWEQNTAARPCPGPDAPSCWLSDLLHPTRKVVFADTDTLLPAPRDNINGPRITNATEAQLVTQLVFALLASGVPATEIGVITFYRSQLALLRQTVKAYSSGAGLGVANVGQVEMHTADKFQGRDKEVVIVSCVRANETGHVGDLLKDWRRINVAVTRARSKLVMIGSAGTLAKDALLEKLLKLLESRKWVVKLPGDAEASHAFEIGGTAMSVPTPSKTPAKRKIDVLSTIDEEGGEKEGRKALSYKKGIENYLAKRNEGSSGSGGKENAGGGGKAAKRQKLFKVPEKVGKIGGSRGLGGKIRKMGEANAVLRDIVNDALGDVMDVE